MKLHYKGKYDLNPESLPHGEHMPNAVPFKEAENSEQMGIIANVSAIVVLIVLAIPIALIGRDYFNGIYAWIGMMASFLTLFPHEILHALCFKEDVYLYTNWKQGLLFVVGPETMSKGHFIFMSLLPNIVFGWIPYAVGLLFPQYICVAIFGAFCSCMGAGDYYNVFNATTQMPKGARTYLYQFNSYWYMPEK